MAPPRLTIPVIRLRDKRQKFAQHARVNRHVVNALLGLLLDHFEHHVDVQILGATHARDCLVDRHGADGNRRCIDDGLADRGNVAAGGEVHHRIGAVVHGAMKFFEFAVNVRCGGGIADVRVDLAEKRNADAHRFEAAMVNIGGNDRAAARHFAADEFGRKLFALRHVLHLFGDDALARVMHLRKIPRAPLTFQSVVCVAAAVAFQSKHPAFP